MKRLILWVVALCLFGRMDSTAGLVAERVYLSGKGPSDAVEWDFYCSAGRQSGEWTTIPVPSCWEQEGFGAYNYGQDDPADKHDETGTYRIAFTMPEAWKDKHVRLVFEGAMTQTSIKINGKSVGFPNYGGYLPFRYVLNHTNVKYGQENVLEVLVKKKPDNDSLDQAERKADYWVFGGIYRPVYLEVQPRVFVNRVAIDARADGAFKMDVFPQVQVPYRFGKEYETHVDELVAQIQTLDGRDVGAPMVAPIRSAAGRIRLKAKIHTPATWSPEYPNLYQVKLTLKHEGQPLSEKVERFGFRTMEHRPQDGLYLNGKRIMIQGVNRNVFDSQKGRAVDADQVWADARLIKSMNVNLVRSHLPPTTEFMQACDELGLMVITELCNWHDPVIDTPIARNLVCELIAKYQNHPSVILWANGNENGYNLDVDELYHLYDLQNRPTIHPWAYYEGLNTKHYPDWDALTLRLGQEDVYLPTEFLHGLYDGGHGAGLEDYWAAMRASPISAGGVLWCWADAALARTDQSGKLDTHGNMSADGVVGPNGEKEASYYSIREIWSPVQIDLDTLPENFDGRLPLENRYVDTRLDACVFEWKWVNYSGPFEPLKIEVAATGQMPGPKVQPGKSGRLRLPLPANWKQYSALELRALSRTGVELMQWTWPIAPAVRPTAKVPVESAKDNPFEVTVGKATWSFSSQTGQLMSCAVAGRDAGLGRGPVLYAGTVEKALALADDWTASVSTVDGAVVVQSKNKNGSSFQWTLADNGRVTLDYAFNEITNALAYCAVGFDLPAGCVQSKRWLGQGPHRIWANRRRGPQVGLWQNAYNDSITGVDWGEPEFKGIFGQVDWMQLALKSGASLLIDPAAASDLGVLRPHNADETRDEKNGIGPVKAWWHYPPAGGLFLFHKLPGVGTKFAHAEQLGPQSRPAQLNGPIQGQVSFAVQ